MKKWFGFLFGQKAKTDTKKQMTQAKKKVKEQQKKAVVKAGQTHAAGVKKTIHKSGAKAIVPKKTVVKGNAKKIDSKESNKKNKGITKTPPKKAVQEKKPATPPPTTLEDEKALEHFGSRLTSLNGSPAGQNLYDVAAYFIKCSTHGKVALCSEKVGYVWLPFVSISSANTWSEAALDGAYVVLSGGDANALIALKEGNAISRSVCMQLFRLQLPQTQKFNVRITYYIELNPKARSFKCCTNSGRLFWLTVKELKNTQMKSLWGPEVYQMATKLTAKVIETTVSEYSLDKAFMYVPRDPPRNLEEDMLKSCNFSEKDVERLYGDFIEHCFPAFFMTKTSFGDYMSKYGFEKMDKRLELLFKAFNFNKDGQGYLSFHEYLLGLTSIDPMATNGQSRIKFLFKYFDVDGDGALSEKEFTSMVREMNPTESKSVIEKKVKEAMAKIGRGKKGVPFDKFFAAVGAHKFRGTSILCRSNRPILAQISRSMATRSLKKAAIQSNLTSILQDRKYEGVCPSCKEKKFDYATHVVRISMNGQWVDAEPLRELSQIERSQRSTSNIQLVSNEKLGRKESKTNSTDSKKVTPKPSSTGIVSFSNDRFSKDIVWNKKSVANYFLEQIRAFNLKKGTKDQKKGLFDSSAERAPFVQKLKELCGEVEKILVLEDRCVKVSSPVFIIGDIHGNLEDLLTMEKVLWRSYPIVAANYVFLGDYVDRGQWGLECALYLMCMKLLAPNKVTLLRGNHETRVLQKKYSYKKECLHKYGDKLGEEVQDVTNKVFDKLPFCAVIDDAIFCAHGGIPYSVRMIEKINEVKVELKEVENDSQVAWEIMWADPVGPTQFAETCELVGKSVETTRGYIENKKRGTGYLFAEEAANTFLQANELTHIVRAHEVPANGYTFHFGNKCVTVFSCSHYCGNNNEAAVIHVDDEKLRVIKLDTVNNSAAS